MNSRLLSNSNILECTLLGSPSIKLNGKLLSGFATSKSQAILFYLAVEGQPKTRDELASLLWEGMPNNRARKNLRDALYQLRKVADELLEVNSQVVYISSRYNVIVDVNTFLTPLTDTSAGMQFLNPSSRSLSRSASLLDGECPTEKLWSQLYLYKGEFLEGFSVQNAPEFDSWCEQLRTAVHQLAISRGLRLLRTELAAGNQRNALKVSTWLLDVDSECREAQATRANVMSQLDEGAQAAPGFIKSPPEESQPEWKQIDSLYDRKTKSVTKPLYAVETQLFDDQHNTHDLTLQRFSSDLDLAYTTDFIGYQRELQRIDEFLNRSGSRLLTVLGPGGVGKTRLVQEVVYKLRESSLGFNAPDPLSSRADTQDSEQFPDGIYFVALAHSHSKRRGNLLQAEAAIDMITIEIADSIRLPLIQGVCPREQLINALRGKSLLLILDNFEHFLSGKEYLTQLLSASLGICIIVTSRERLNLYSERLLTLHGLSVSDYHLVASRNEANSYATTESDEFNATQAKSEVNSASLLFINRANSLRETTLQQGLSPSPLEHQAYQNLAVHESSTSHESSISPWVPNADEIELIQQIVQLVGGLPLAIEIAAALSLQLDLVEIVTALEQDLTILHVHESKLNERHRNISPILEAMWAHLSLHEQELLTRLVYFQGGFSLSSALKIANALPETLMTLANKSIITVRDKRYGIHPLIHQYISQKVARPAYEAAPSFDGQTQSDIEAAYCSYYQEFLGVQINRWRSTHDMQALEEVIIEYDNIIHAWQLLLMHDNIPMIVAYGKDLWRFARARGRLYTIESLLKDGIEAIRSLDAEASPSAQVELLQLLSATYNQQGKLNKSSAYGKEALRLLGHKLPTQQWHLLWRIVCELIVLLWRYVARPHVKDSDSNDALLGWVYNNLTQNHYFLNNTLDATYCSLRAANLATLVNRPLLTTYAYTRVSILLGFLKLKPLYEHFLSEAENAALLARDLNAQTAVLFFRGLHLISHGKCDQAKPLLEKALAQYEIVCEWSNMGDSLALLNVIACHQGEHTAGLEYGLRLETIAEKSQNLELSAWANLIQSTNLVYLDRISEAEIQLKELRKNYQQLDFQDIGYFVGHSTKVLIHYRCGEYQEALSAIRQITESATDFLYTSAIYLYMNHAILDTLVGIFEKERHSKNQTQQDELIWLIRHWLCKLYMVRVIHPIGKQYFYYHAGRYCALIGRQRLAAWLLHNGYTHTQRNGDSRNQTYFQIAIKKYLGEKYNSKSWSSTGRITSFKNKRKPS